MILTWSGGRECVWSDTQLYGMCVVCGVCAMSALPGECVGLNEVITCVCAGVYACVLVCMRVYAGVLVRGDAGYIPCTSGGGYCGWRLFRQSLVTYLIVHFAAVYSCRYNVLLCLFIYIYQYLFI